MFGRLRNLASKTGGALRPFRRNSWLAAVIIILIGATQLTLLWRPAVGIYVNAASFVILIALALLRSQSRDLAVSVAIIPVSMMIALSLPATTIFASTTVFYSSLLLLGLLYRFAFTLDYPLRNTKLSLRNYALAVPLMVVVGQVLGVIGYGMLRNHYTFDHTSLPLVAAAAVVFAVAEETVFRGLIQQRASQIMHPILAAIISTSLFTFMSIDATTVLAPLFGLLLGAVLAAIYYKKQSLVLTIAANAATKLTYVGLMAAFVFR